MSVWVLDHHSRCKRIDWPAEFCVVVFVGRARRRASGSDRHISLRIQGRERNKQTIPGAPDRPRVKRRRYVRILEPQGANDYDLVRGKRLEVRAQVRGVRFALRRTGHRQKREAIQHDNQVDATRRACANTRVGKGFVSDLNPWCVALPSSRSQCVEGYGRRREVGFSDTIAEHMGGLAP